MSLLIGLFYADQEKYKTKKTATYKEMKHLRLPLELRSRIQVRARRAQSTGGVREAREC